ncbi:MAG TPA: SCP2 sterol-binding domain-containing protein [Longimicrobiaceae bacterium]|nr:SCP2 sterol-binding domain-containing protein [Longimicrobiaceae bacterium]
MEVFTEEWARACCQALNRSEAYRASAVQWEGSIVLAMAADAAHGITAERAVFIDAHHGECRDAHLASADELSSATYVLSAGPATWKRLLAKEIELVGAVMQGKLRLVRGGLFALAKFAQAARDMVAAAADVGGTFPGSAEAA